MNTVVSFTLKVPVRFTAGLLCYIGAGEASTAVLEGSALRVCTWSKGQVRSYPRV